MAVFYGHCRKNNALVSSNDNNSTLQTLKAMRRYFLLIVLSCIGFVRASSQGTGTAILPYTDDQGAPVVEVVINGNPYRFMLDTGAGMTCVSDRLVNAENLSYSQSEASMQGLGNNLFLAAIPSIGIGALELTAQQGIVMSAENVILSTLGADGIIGANILKNYVLSFDSQKKTITLAANADEAIAGWQPLKLWNNVPLFNIKLQGKDELYDVPALFDSGNGTGAVSLPSVEGFEQWSGAGIITDVTEGRGAVGSMVGGLANFDKIYRGSLNDLHIGNAVFKGLPVMTGGVGYLLLCFKMTDLGRVIIDYPNARYKFEAYEGQTVWDGDCRPVMTGPQDGKLRIAAVWGDEARTKLAPGYIITAVGDTPISGSVEKLANIDELIRAYKAEESSVTVRDQLGAEKQLPASLFLPL